MGINEPHELICEERKAPSGKVRLICVDTHGHTGTNEAGTVFDSMVSAEGDLSVHGRHAEKYDLYVYDDQGRVVYEFKAGGLD